jgi:hypothetical protein
MVENDRILAERLNRILMSIALEKPDRVPVVLEYSGFAAYVTGTQIADFLSSPMKNLETMIQAYHRVGGSDAINYGSFWPYGLCYDYLSKVSVPGVDLPKDEMWQVVETELMTRDDYDLLSNLGWPDFFKKFLTERILCDVPNEYLPPHRKSPDVKKAWQKEGIPVLSGGDVTTPYELLCGSRSLTEFSMDLFEIPDKVIAAMDAIVPYLASNSIRRARQYGYPVVWVGGWRTAPSMLSPEMWQRFVWPYFSRLIRELGPGGFILQSGCDIPANAKLENIQAMVWAALDS